jgi:hypothetical protein
MLEPAESRCCDSRGGGSSYRSDAWSSEQGPRGASGD